MGSEMRDEIIQFVRDEYLEDASQVIDVDTPLISSGIVDSFSMVSLKRFLERKYQIQIPDADASPEAFDNVNSIATLVERFQAKK
jgi:acyl carrier protein